MYSTVPNGGPATLSCHVVGRVRPTLHTGGRHRHSLTHPHTSNIVLRETSTDSTDGSPGTGLRHSTHTHIRYVLSRNHRTDSHLSAGGRPYNDE